MGEKSSRTTQFSALPFTTVVVVVCAFNGSAKMTANPNNASGDFTAPLYAEAVVNSTTVEAITLPF
ncbi:MAG TPA: hypothetical protein VD837_13110 [Terriglobales bacterium]|nr:hypothetical protein [Terriglobales bacterium]